MAVTGSKGRYCPAEILSLGIFRYNHSAILSMASSGISSLRPQASGQVVRWSGLRFAESSEASEKHRHC